MATAGFTQTNADGWVEIAADAEDYLIENRSHQVIQVTQQAAPPADDAPHHILQKNQGMVRVGTGIAYARVEHPTKEGFFVVTT